MDQLRNPREFHELCRLLDVGHWKKLTNEELYLIKGSHTGDFPVDNRISLTHYAEALRSVHKDGTISKYDYVLEPDGELRELFLLLEECKTLHMRFKYKLDIDIYGLSERLKKDCPRICSHLGVYFYSGMLLFDSQLQDYLANQMMNYSNTNETIPVVKYYYGLWVLSGRKCRLNICVAFWLAKGWPIATLQGYMTYMKSLRDVVVCPEFLLVSIVYSMRNNG